jgi:RNA polymerase sigma-70 factor (ECF subfamily)
MTNADFESAVHDHQGMVYSIALHFFHNTAIAEEVAQEVFLKLFEHRRAVETGPHCIAWLRRTAAHRCIDTLRRASFRQEVQIEDLPEVPVFPAESDPLLQEGLRRLIASLPEKPRAVMVLRYGEDMDPEEIGRTLQMPVRTVWSHLQRGTALIREKAARYRMEIEDEPNRTRSSRGVAPEGSASGLR